MSDTTLPNFDALWDYNQPAETEAKFRALLPQAEASGNPGYHCELLTQIARTQGLQRRFEDAHRTLDQAETLLTVTPPRAHIRYLLERGRVFNSSGDRDQARAQFLEAWAAALLASEDFHAVDAAHMIAIATPPDQQMEWNLKALSLAEASQDERARGWLGSLYNNIGWTYHDQGDYERALDVFERGRAFRAAQGQAREEQIARWTVARALRSLHRLDEALAMQRTLLDDLNAAGIRDGYVEEELGECLLALGKADEAAPHFARAYAELAQDEWMLENEAARMERLKTLAR